jgi:predicted RecA/RadA family phage recombinase
MQCQILTEAPSNIDYTLGGNVSEGDVVIIGGIFARAMSDGTTGQRISLRVYAPKARIAKNTGGTMSQGDEVFWDDSNKYVSKTATVGKRAGIVAADAASNDTTVDIFIEPGSKQAAVVAALTDNSGGAAADGTIGAVTTFTPSVAWNGSSVYPSAADATAIAAAITALMAAVKELSTKVNEIIAGQKTAGQMANS